MIQLPKWLWYTVLIIAIGAVLSLSAIVALRRKESWQPPLSSIDSLALQQKDDLISRLQTRIEVLEEKDSLLKVIDAKLEAKMATNEKDLRKNIDRVRQLHSAGHSALLSKNLSESISYRRRYNYLFEQPPDSSHK